MDRVQKVLLVVVDSKQDEKHKTCEGEEVGVLKRRRREGGKGGGGEGREKRGDKEEKEEPLLVDDSHHKPPHFLFLSTLIFLQDQPNSEGAEAMKGGKTTRSIYTSRVPSLNCSLELIWYSKQ